MKTITEGKAILKVPGTGKVSKKMSVFYNPYMKDNRSIAVLLLNSINKNPRVADIMAGTGIRSIRLLLETNVEQVEINDISKEAVKLIKSNLKLNKLKINVHNKDSNEFLLSTKGFDYIEIDPFGSPNKFLESAAARISRNGILAVTATDTSALSGTFKNACKRKYWATPMRNYLMHEVGLRILIRRCQLAGTEYDKALIPIFSHSTLHYMRVYLKCVKGKQKVDSILKYHKYFHYCSKCMNHFVNYKNQETCCSLMLTAGPLWTGKLWDSNLVKRMLKQNDFPELYKLLETISSESKVSTVGFYSLHKISSKLKISAPKISDVVMKLEEKGFKASPTHFSGNGIRSNAPISEITMIVKAIKP